MLKSINNFRDFGGYETMDGKTIKSGMIFRSGSTDKISGKDLSYLKSLGIKTIIDLRPKREQRNNGRLKILNKVTIPFDIDNIAKARTKPFLFKKGSEKNIIEAVSSVYEEMPERLTSPVHFLFELLRYEQPYPLLINCRAGKDRTGFAAAIIQLALGVNEEMIIMDYMKTNQYILPRIEKMLQFLDIISFGKIPVNNFRTALTAHEDYIRTTLNVINNTYEGIYRYLNYCGIEKSDIDKIKNVLLK